VFDRIGRDIPGFAGFYLSNDGILVARLTDMTQATMAGSALAEIALAVSGSTSDVIIESAEYDFASLRNWRDMLRPLLGPSGVTGLDADERANRVWIGIASDGMRASIMSRLEELAIPLGAVVIEKSEPELRVATLRDSIRPLPGGMQIQGQGLGFCTMNSNGTHATFGSGFVTASHCTGGTPGAVNSTEFFQPDIDAEGIGVEVVDAPVFTGGPCPTGRVCQEADAAFIEYHLGGTGEFGRIAQPNVKCTSDCIDNPTALAISTTNPRWRIHSTLSGLITQGIGVQKVGRTTGWTSGEVINSCYVIPREDLQWPRKLWIRRGRSGQAAVMSARGKRFLRY
jgi:hypothetical protein